MTTTTNTTTSASTVFDADDYQAETGTFADMEGSTTSDLDSVTTQSDFPEAHPRYVPPHRRHVKLDMGDFVQVDARNPLKPDLPGVANRHFEKLLHFVHFCLTASNIKSLISRFPAVHFACDDHRNHDHPIAHVVTAVGTRFLQRMFPAGATILDVYGNPAGSKSFNASQSKAKTPKFMMPLVNLFCGADFIREVNKWGPIIEDDQPQYIKGKIDELGAKDLADFSHFQLIHTLYYLSVGQVAKMLSYRPGAKALCLIHSHSNSNGKLNEGEQEYWVRGGVVKQKNVKTNTCYYHPNITPFWFREDKTWYPDNTKGETGNGIAWECHLVCEDTWIVEIVAADRSRLDDGAEATWKALFDFHDNADNNDLLSGEPQPDPVRILPSADGKFVELRVTCIPLFESLRRQAAGKPRVGAEGRKLFDSLLGTAKHLNAPGELFPGKDGMPCEAQYLIDHVVSAWVTDVSRESDIMSAAELLRPAMFSHASKVKGGPKLANFTLSNLFDSVRAGVSVALTANRVLRNADPIGSALTHLDLALEVN
jgi:hypothetical protein